MRKLHAARMAIAAAIAWAVLAAVLLAPTSAFAASATFSSKTPKNLSSSTVTKPRVYVYIVDKYGIKGATSFSMSIDGRKVKPKITYKTSGSYKRVALTFQVTTALTVRTHVVAVKVKNIRKQTSSTSWKFTVLAPPPPEMPVVGVACVDCHAGYPAAHPMTACAACHGAAAPLRTDGTAMNPYAAGDKSAHTLGCSLQTVCHRGGGVFPHALDGDCARCHTGDHAGIPAVHSQPLTSYHVSASAFCTRSGCHLASLTKEHYRRAPGGVPLNCATCHASADPLVRAAIDGESTACEDCHRFTSSVHPNTATAHGTPAVSCTAAACHPGQAAALHAGAAGGCSVCHGSAAAATTACATCHTTGRYHAALPAAHTVAAPACTVTGCHAGGTDVSAIHESEGCGTCHKVGLRPTLVCASAGCHTADSGASHNAHPASVVSTGFSILGSSYGTHLCSECHAATELQAVHGGSSSCAKCHPAPRSSVAVWNKGCVQGDCHKAGTPLAMHGSIDTSHTLKTVPSCIAADCHTGGTSAVAIHGAAGGPGCAACHAVGKKATLVCATSGCHGASDAHPASNPHPKMAPGHTTGLTTGCVKAGCHVADLAALHSSGATHPGCAACHAAGRPALTKICATVGCHPGGAPASHASHPSTATSVTVTILGAAYGKHLCSECHASTELQAAHGGSSSCSKCHPAPRSSFTVWNKTCVQGDCHKVGTARAMHGSVDTSHAIAIAPSCIATDCHVGGTDVVKIHGVAGGPGCAACHAVGEKATLVCATSGCHGQSDSHPSANPHPKMAPGHTAGLSATCVKAGCHAADLAQLHTPALRCATCHGTAAAAPKDCATAACHPYAVSATTLHPAYVTGHVAPSGGCVAADCHVADVITLHTAGATPPGCAACHAAGKPPLTTLCSTVGCHASGAPESHTSHPSTVTSGTVTILGAGYGKHLCSECHATTELQVAHGGLTGCSKCHPAPRSSFTVWNKTCVQGDCHKVGTPRAMHGSIDTSHTLSSAPSCVATDCHVGGTDVVKIHGVAGGPGCAACHAVGRNATLACATSGCHGATDAHPASNPHPKMTPGHTTGLTTGCVKAGCHVTDLAALHSSGATHPGCAACHAAGKPALTKICATAGCHPGGAPASHTSHPAAVTSSTITILSAGYGKHLCSECHATTELQVAHGGTASCSKCHPSPRSSFTVWNKTCVQGDCHKTGTPRAMHGSIDTSHTLASAPSCIATDCHVGGTSAAAIHGAAGGPGCAACHAVGKKPTLVCATSGCHGASDAHPASAPHPKMTSGHTTALSLTCVKAGCHAADLGALHSPALGCATCHSGGTSAVKDCATTGCHAHSVASTTLHPKYVTGHTAEAGGCISTGCHVANVLTLHTTGTTPPGCGACHAAGKPPLTTECSTVGCHATGAPASHDSHPAKVTSSTITILGTGYGKHLCSECHPTVELQAVHGGRSSCAKCHPAPRSSFTVWTKGCVQGDCHKIGTALGMHGSIDQAHTLGSAPSCIATDCHTGGTNAVAIHAVAGGPGCAACHGAGKTTTLVCATSGCHSASDPHPASNPHPKMGPGHMSGLPTTCEKAGCHTASLGTLHKPTPGCSLCHGAGKTPSKDCAAAACHPYAVTSATLHPNYVAKHAVTQAPACAGADCHSGSTDVGAIHTSGATPPGCEACHAADKPPLTTACSTTGCHDSGLADLHPATAHTVNQHPCTSANCHGSNAAKTHEGSESTCAACHTAGVAQTNSCSSCHPLSWASRHAVYAVTSDFHGGAVGNGDSSWGWYSDGWILPPYTRGMSMPCATCHVPAGTTNLYDFPYVVNGNPVNVTTGTQLTTMCVSCHGGSVDQWHAGCFGCHAGGMGAGGPLTMVGTDCSDCHQHGMNGWPHGPWSFQGATL